MKALLQVSETRAIQPEVERAAPGFEDALEALGAETADADAAESSEPTSLTNEATSLRNEGASIAKEAAQVTMPVSPVQDPKPEVQSPQTTELTRAGARTTAETDAELATDTKAASPKDEATAQATEIANTGADTSAWRVLQSKTQHALRPNDKQTADRAKTDNNGDGHPKAATQLASNRSFGVAVETAPPQKDTIATSIANADEPGIDVDRSTRAAEVDSSGPNAPGPGPFKTQTNVESAAPFPAPEAIGTDKAALLGAAPRTAASPFPADATPRQDTAAQGPVLQTHTAVPSVDAESSSGSATTTTASTQEPSSSAQAILPVTEGPKTAGTETSSVVLQAVADPTESDIAGATPSRRVDRSELADRRLEVPAGTPVPIRQRRLFEFSAEAKFRARHASATKIDTRPEARSIDNVTPTDGVPSPDVSLVEAEVSVLDADAPAIVTTTPRIDRLPAEPKQAAEHGAEPPPEPLGEVGSSDLTPINRPRVGDSETILQAQALQQSLGGPGTSFTVPTDVATVDGPTPTAAQAQSQLSKAEVHETQGTPVADTSDEASVDRTASNQSAPRGGDEARNNQQRTEAATLATPGESPSASSATQVAAAQIPLDASPSDVIAAAFARASSPAATTLASDPTAAAKAPTTSPVMPGEGETFDSVVSLRDAETAELQVGRGDERVKVILRERGENIHVSAQTATPEMAEALLSDARELGTSLENHGFDLASFEATTDEQAESDAEGEALNAPDNSQTMTQTVLHRRRIVA